MLTLVWLLVCYIKSNELGQLFHTLSQKFDITVSALRKYERCLLRLEKQKCDLAFLISCRQLDIIPKFLNFRIPKFASTSSQKSFQRKCLFSEIKKKERDISNTSSEADQLKTFYKNRLTFFYYITLNSLVYRSIKKKKEDWKATLDNKLRLAWFRQRLSSPDNTLQNNSSHQLSLEEENALRLGLGHPIAPPTIDRLGIQCSFEKFANICFKVNGVVGNEFVNGLKHFSHSYLYNNANDVKCYSNKALHRVLRRLRNNDKIKICRYDKGTGTVILDSSDYHAKLDDIVNTEKFVKLCVEPIDDCKKHPVIKTENAIQYYLKTYIKDHVTKDIYETIFPNGCHPGALYGLAKVHKPNCPLRPVVSMIGTPQYNLGKYLDSIIKPVIPSQHMLSSTNEFIDKLKECVLPKNNLFVSFDVVSLFTNVPLNEVIDICCDLVYDNDSPTKPGYSKKHFKRLLQFATGGEFMYNDQLYKQVDGVAMGSPLAPTLANLFMSHLESSWLSSNDTNVPLCYYRYVDDIFLHF